MYMLILILFHFVAQVFLSNVAPRPSPLSQLLILIPLSLALPRLFPTPGLGRAAHVCMVRLAAIWQSYPSGSLYKQPQFTVSSVVPVKFSRKKYFINFPFLNVLYMMGKTYKIKFSFIKQTSKQNEGKFFYTSGYFMKKLAFYVVDRFE